MNYVFGAGPGALLSDCEALSRRGFARWCASQAATLALCLGGMAGFAGCSAEAVRENRRLQYYDLHDDGHHHRGFADDAEVADYPVTIVGYVDELVDKIRPNTTKRTIDDVIERYQGNDGRADVTVELRYVHIDEARRIAKEGIDDAGIDFLIASKPIMEEAIESGTVYGGPANNSVRDLACLNSSSLWVMRARGSKADLPKADTFDGKEVEDPGGGVIKTRMMELDKFAGKIGVLPESQHEGAWTRRALYKAGFYTDESGQGGTIDSALDDVLVEFESPDALRKALLSGECDLGFLFNWDEGDDLEAIYRPRLANPSTNFQGASFPSSAEGGVARDFLQYVFECA